MPGNQLALSVLEILWQDIRYGARMLDSPNLTNGAFYFIDRNWTNYPTRFYRIRSP